jgi:hypothetical protein
VAYDTTTHGESPRRRVATQHTREQHTDAGLLCRLAAYSLVEPVSAHARRGLCPCSISILCHAHSNRISTGCNHHRLSWAHQHGLRRGVVARWQAVMTVPSRSGTRRVGTASSLLPGIQLPREGSPGRPMGRVSPRRVRMEPSRCGMRRAGVTSLPIVVKQLPSGPWPGLQMGCASPRRPAIAVTSSRERRCRYGTPPPGTS